MNNEEYSHIIKHRNMVAVICVGSFAFVQKYLAAPTADG
jgi:hypothetical protein